MFKEAIYHKYDSEYCYALSKHELVVRLRTKKNDVNTVNFLYSEKYSELAAFGQYKVEAEMEKVSADDLFDYYEAIVEVDLLGVAYCFEIIEKDKVIYYGDYKFLNRYPRAPRELFMITTLTEQDIFEVPAWAKRAIVYQVFPERFCNGDSKNDPQNTQSWDAQVTYQSMLGGDLRGMINKLDYLQELGINLIYLTPIFESNTNHKYNTFDYYKVDPHFGTLEDMKELVQKAHQRNIKVMLDAVFNHCGEKFAPFQDVLEKGEESKYKDWFDIRNFPVEVKKFPSYTTFAHFGEMPKLMTKNKEVAKYLIDVATYWIKETDIDGWRLDVADDVDHEFWRAFRKAIKEVKPDAFIVGEVWYDSHAWLKGDQFDSVMNYPFFEAVKLLVGQEKISVQEFDANLGFVRSLYKQPAYQVLWNMLNTHDTARFLHFANEDAERLKLAAFIQMTYPGVPMIYYGDEVGMTGAQDPDCRRGMIWDPQKQDQEILAHYKKIISLRKEYEALQLGDVRTIYIDNDKQIYGFRRLYKGQRVDIYINNDRINHEIEIPWEGSKIHDVFNDIEFEVKDQIGSIQVNAKSGCILA